MHNFNRIVLESYGTFPGCEELAKYIVSYARRNTGRLKDGSSVDIPVDSQLTNSIHLSCGSNYFDASYDLEKSVWNKAEGKFESVYISTKPQYLNVPSIVHELTHAYQDCMLRRKNMRYVDIEDKRGYLYYSEFPDEDNEAKRDAGLILYILDSFERGAYFAELTSLIEDELEGKEISNMDDIISAIKQNSYYKAFNGLIRKVSKYFGGNDSMKKKNKTLSLFNSMSGNRFRNYHHLKSYVMLNTNRLRKKLDYIIPKIAMRLMQKYNLSQQHPSSRIPESLNHNNKMNQIKMKKKIVRLTEADLHRIISDCLNEVFDYNASDIGYGYEDDDVDMLDISDASYDEIPDDVLEDDYIQTTNEEGINFGKIETPADRINPEILDRFQKMNNGPLTPYSPKEDRKRNFSGLTYGTPEQRNPSYAEEKRKKQEWLRQRKQNVQK